MDIRKVWIAGERQVFNRAEVATCPFCRRGETLWNNNGEKEFVTHWWMSFKCNGSTLRVSDAVRAEEL